MVQEKCDVNPNCQDLSSLSPRGFHGSNCNFWCIEEYVISIFCVYYVYILKAIKTHIITVTPFPLYRTGQF